MSQAFFLYCEYGRKIGHGHLKRCLKIRDALDAAGYQVSYYFHRVESQDEGRKLPQTKIIHKILAMGRPDYVILDIAHSNYFDYNFFQHSIDFFNKYCRKSIIVFDGTSAFSFRNHFDVSGFNIVFFAPYYESNPGFNQKVIWDIRYQFFHKTAIGTSIKKISRSGLLTCGFTDPFDMTVLFLKKFFGFISNEFTVFNVVVSDGFSDQYIENIISVAPRNVELLVGLSDLTNEFLRHEAIFSADGSTKYELYALGVPPVLFSADKEFFLANNDFSNLNFGCHLGVLKDCSMGKMERVYDSYRVSNIGNNNRRPSLCYDTRSFVNYLGDLQ